MIISCLLQQSHEFMDDGSDILGSQRIQYSLSSTTIWGVPLQKISHSETKKIAIIPCLLQRSDERLDDRSDVLDSKDGRKWLSPRKQFEDRFFYASTNKLQTSQNQKSVLNLIDHTWWQENKRSLSRDWCTRGDVVTNGHCSTCITMNSDEVVKSKLMIVQMTNWDSTNLWSTSPGTEMTDVCS